MIFQRSEIRRKLEKIQQDQLRSLNTSSGSLIPSDLVLFFNNSMSTRYFKRAGFLEIFYFSSECQNFRKIHKLSIDAADIIATYRR